MRGPATLPRPALLEDAAGADDILDIGIGDDILVVDDSHANLVAAEAALEPLGRRVVCVSSGVEALTKLLEQDFALILLDVAMPGISGIETARMIRARERSRGTPILFVTGMSWHDKEIDEAYEVGGFDFVVKPVRAEVLRAKARVFLTLQERTRALRRQADELRASQARLHEHELHEQRSRFESELLDSKLQQLADGTRRHHALAGIIGNELLNPLQTLQMAFDLLREHLNALGTLGAAAGERIHSVVEHRLVHVTRLVKVLIDVAQVGNGQLEIHTETVDVADVAAEAIDECKPLIDGRRLTVRLDADPAVTPLIMGDRARLRQAITGLIDRAARSTDAGGQIIVTSSVTARDVVLRISDTGRGIAPAQLPRIFEIFADDGAPSSDAVNLGLTLVKRLVELHDGTICASSPGLGKGTTFELRLPLGPQDVELSSTEIYLPQDLEIAPELAASSPGRLAAPGGSAQTTSRS